MNYRQQLLLGAASFQICIALSQEAIRRFIETKVDPAEYRRFFDGC